LQILAIAHLKGLVLLATVKLFISNLVSYFLQALQQNKQKSPGSSSSTTPISSPNSSKVSFVLYTVYLLDFSQQGNTSIQSVV